MINNEICVNDSKDSNCVCNIVSERLRIVRDAHKISSFNVAIIAQTMRHLKHMAKGVISKWENGRSMPDIDALLSFADIFGVSVQWLIGRSKSIYDSDNLLAIERSMFSNYINVDSLMCIEKENQEITIFPPHNAYRIPIYYIDEKQRELYYPPAIRGNIIFLLNLYMTIASDVKGIVRYADSENNKIEVNPNAFFSCQKLVEIAIELSKYHLGNSNNILESYSQNGSPQDIRDVPLLFDIEAEMRKKLR